MRFRLPLICIVILLFWSCADDDNDIKPFTAYDESIIQYFNEVALGFEFGSASEVTRKWTTEMKVFVGGQKNKDLMSELSTITNEINKLATDGFSISIVTDTLKSNFYIFLGPSNHYATIFPSQASLLQSNWGLFSVSFNSSNQITGGQMYVDLARANYLEEKHLLREELTQSLGLAKDSFKYNESIFQQNWTTTTAYTELDKDLIRLLYHPKMKTGLNRSEVDELLREIIISEK